MKRWLMGTHQGAVSREHLNAYFNEFSFRFNRRNSRHRGMLFLRLLENAVEVAPIRYTDLIRYGRTKRVVPVPPASAGRSTGPGSVLVAEPERPWRA